MLLENGKKSEVNDPIYVFPVVSSKGGSVVKDKLPTKLSRYKSMSWYKDENTS